MKRIYVGNLAPETDEVALQSLFQQYGHVSKAGIICDHQTGQPRGFGFVLMRNDIKAGVAIEVLNGSKLNGQTIRVLEALPPAGKQKESERIGTARNVLDRFRGL
jgi:RNA recognition motif-containing protein